MNKQWMLNQLYSPFSQVVLTGNVLKYSPLGKKIYKYDRNILSTSGYMVGGRMYHDNGTAMYDSDNESQKPLPSTPYTETSHSSFPGFVKGT